MKMTLELTALHTQAVMIKIYNRTINQVSAAVHLTEFKLSNNRKLSDFSQTLH